MTILGLNLRRNASRGPDGGGLGQLLRLKWPAESVLSVTASGADGQISGSTTKSGAMERRLGSSQRTSLAALYGVSNMGRQVRQTTAQWGGENASIPSTALSSELSQWFDEALSVLGTRALRCHFTILLSILADFSSGFFEIQPAPRLRSGLAISMHCWAISTTSDRIARVKTDYRATVSELLLEILLRPGRNGRIRKEVLSRNQAARISRKFARSVMGHPIFPKRRRLEEWAILSSINSPRRPRIWPVGTLLQRKLAPGSASTST